MTEIAKKRKLDRLIEKITWYTTNFNPFNTRWIFRWSSTLIVGTFQAMYKMTRESHKGGLSAEEKTKEIFMKMDKNQDGNLSMQEFIKGVQTDVSILRLLTSASNTGWMAIIPVYTLLKLSHIIFMLYLWELRMYNGQSEARMFLMILSENTLVQCEYKLVLRS